jgi:hypothetical protein
MPQLPRATYPVIPPMTPNVEAPPAQRSVQERKAEKKKDPERRPEPPKTVVPPPPAVVTPPIPLQPPPPQAEKAITTVNIAGHEIRVPETKEVVQAGTTAVLGTTATLITATVFNQVRRALGEAVTKVKRDKFKIKLRRVKPVLHFVDNGQGSVEVIEYSGEGMRVIASDVVNPEQFLRDTVEADELFESDHRIVIDDPLKNKFSREGAKRFNYFAPPKKMARRLAARFIFG